MLYIFYTPGTLYEMPSKHSKLEHSMNAKAKYSEFHGKMNCYQINLIL